MSIGFPKRSKQSRKRARQKAERDAWREAERQRPPEPKPKPETPAQQLAGYFGGDPVLGAVLGAIARIRESKCERPVALERRLDELAARTQEIEQGDAGPAHDLPPLRESRRAQPTDTSELRREDNMSCSTCHFAKPTTEIDGALVCRRYPPVPLPGYGFGQWPVVRHTSWCGEWAVRS